MKGIIGRLALNLHVLWELDAGKACPSEEIPLFIMEMAIALAKFYIGQVKLVHADSDDESLPRHITKLIELSKRLEANEKDGWIKAQQYREQFQPKKRPSAQQARDWMKEAVIQGHGRTRGTGNRLEFHWLRDNNSENNPPPPPDNLGMLGMVRDDLGMTHPEVKTIDNIGLDHNLGMFWMGIPNLSQEEASSLNTGEEGSEPSLEGGYIPEPSRSSPKKGCDVEPVGDTNLGNNLGMPIPNHPEVPEVCDSSVPAGTHQRQERNQLSERIHLAQAPTAAAEREEVDLMESEEAIADLAGILEVCDSKKLLAEIRSTDGFTPSVLKLASKRLSPDKRNQIKKWVIELDQVQSQQQLPDATEAKVGKRIRYVGEYSGGLSALSKNGGFFVAWDTSSQRQAQRRGFELPAVLKVADFELLR
jgi:hypothetical protein